MNQRPTEETFVWKKEIVGGVTTFLTMSYIIVVNPRILSAAGMEFSGVMTATVLVTFLMTLLMGLYAKLPFAVAPGMGLNAFFAYTLVLGMNVPWQVALGIVFWSGILFVLISGTRLREMIAQAMPGNIRVAVAVGIGFFLTFIGLKNLGLVVGDPVTLVKFGALNVKTVTALVGLLFMTWLMIHKSPFAFINGIVAIAIISWVMGWAPMPEKILSAPDFSSVLLKLDIVNALQWSLVPAIITVVLTILFDSLSTFMGVAKAANLLDAQGQPRNLRQGLIVDSLASISSGLAGTSPAVPYIESAAGIEMGGRTGRASIVTALCFLPCLFIAPLAVAIPEYATAPVLILVGALMFRNVKDFDFTGRFEDLIPAFLTVVLVPLTFSITQGILWGFIAHSLMYVLVGRAREVKPTMYGLSIVSVVLLLVENVFV
jgi:AGZA family xanthine/uracil permease-like MFS transporter